MLTEEPSNAFVPLLGSANMRCNATGIPQPDLQWYKEGFLLPGETGSVLVFEEVSLSDRGFYHCTATNNEGIDTSDSAVLSVTNLRQYLTPVYVSFSLSGAEDFTVADLVEQLNSQAAGLEVNGLFSSVVFLYRVELFGSPVNVSSTM